jgi:hypothetical protein
MKSLLFYCRNTPQCQRTGLPAPNGRIPDGWYSVARGWSYSYPGMIKLGLFCSVLCLDEHLKILYQDEMEHPVEAEEVPA